MKFLKLNEANISARIAEGQVYAASNVTNDKNKPF